MVTTLPRSGAADVTSFAENDFALGSSSSPSFGNFEGIGEQITLGGKEGLRGPVRSTSSPAVSFAGTKDWREL